jgi:hypothetical protein
MSPLAYIQKILDDLFKDSNIKEENRAGYLALADYYQEPKSFKNSHFKKLRKRLKKEITKECK